MRPLRNSALGSTLVAGLAAAAVLSIPQRAASQGAAPWALGEQPNFSGRIPNWADGDAIAPAAANILALYSWGFFDDDIEVGVGVVDAAGNFRFGLQTGSTLPDGGQTALDVLCSDATAVSVSVSNADQRLVVVNSLEVPALYEEGRHARPLGGILIREAPPTAMYLVDRYAFVYATADGTVRGSCSDGEYTVDIDLDLRQGWNSALMTLESGFAVRTAAIPSSASWYLVNPVVLGRE